MSTLRAALILILAGSATSAFAEQINCESRGDQTEACGTIQPGSDVRLVQQISNSPCIQGRTWGSNDDSLWVSGGCRAVFDVQPPYARADRDRAPRDDERYEGSRYAGAEQRREHVRHACVRQAAAGRYSRDQVTASDAQWIGEGLFSVNLDTPDGPLTCTVDRDGNIRSIDSR